MRVAFIGFGGVAQAVARAIIASPVLSARFTVVSITDRAGTLAGAPVIDLAHALDAKAQGDLGLAARHGARWRDWGAREAIARVDADVVIELSTTNFEDAEPATSHVEDALRAGRHVVTANKGPLALHYARVTELAATHDRKLLYSATVCGGTPVLELLSRALDGDRLERIEGVVNGSTNFILNEMEGGAGFEEALLTARTRGILEADASLDILGHDARAKACILHNHAFGATHGNLALADVRVRGIQGITRAEVADAQRNGMALRLVAAIEPGRAGVRPCNISREHALVVPGTWNAVQLKFDLAGPVTLTGAGAGGRETASAVLSDLVHLAARAPRPRAQEALLAP